MALEPSMYSPGHGFQIFSHNLILFCYCIFCCCYFIKSSANFKEEVLLLREGCTSIHVETYDTCDAGSGRSSTYLTERVQLPSYETL